MPFFLFFLFRNALGGKVKRWDFYVRTNHDEVKKTKEKRSKGLLGGTLTKRERERDGKERKKKGKLFL